MPFDKLSSGASLSAIEMFKGLPASCLAAMEKSREAREYSAGHIFFRPGESGQVHGGAGRIAECGDNFRGEKKDTHSFAFAPGTRGARITGENGSLEGESRLLQVRGGGMLPSEF